MTRDPPIAKEEETDDPSRRSGRLRVLVPMTWVQGLPRLSEPSQPQREQAFPSDAVQDPLRGKGISDKSGLGLLSGRHYQG